MASVKTLDIRDRIAQERVEEALRSDNWSEGKRNSLIFKGGDFSVEITSKEDVIYKSGAFELSILPNQETYSRFVERIRDRLGKTLSEFIKELDPTSKDWKRISQSNPDLRLPSDYTEIEGFRIQNGKIVVWVFELTRNLGGEPIKSHQMHGIASFGPYQSSVFESVPLSEIINPPLRRLLSEIRNSSPEFKAAAELKASLHDRVEQIRDWREDAVITPHWSSLKLLDEAFLGREYKNRELMKRIKGGERLAREDLNLLMSKLPQELKVTHNRIYGHFTDPVLGECTIRIEQIMSHDDLLLGANVKVRQRQGENQGELTQRVFLRITDTERALQLFAQAKAAKIGLNRL